MAGVKTFVVRLFVPAGPEIPSGGLHGIVEEVAGGRRTAFSGGEELLALLAQPAAEPEADLVEQPVP